MSLPSSLNANNGTETNPVTQIAVSSLGSTTVASESGIFSSNDSSTTDSSTPFSSSSTNNAGNSVTTSTSRSNNSTQSSTTSVSVKSGYAKIKPEFLLHDHKPSIQAEYLSADTKRKFELDKDDGEQEEETDLQPASKKQKLKGRNKQRPHNVRIDNKEKLCPAIKDGRECKFGDGCKFNHDLKEYMEKKIPDIDGKCPVYEKLGICRFGVTCRFASSHTGENMENLINEEVYEKTKDKPLSINALTEDIRNKLWKRKYDFSKALSSVKAAQSQGTLDSSKSQGAAQEPVIEKTSFQTVDDCFIRQTPREVRKIDFRNQLFLAPLTTVGNLPFRRVCKTFGADITCSEMAVASQLLKGKSSEWSLIKRHPSEDIFGVQLCGGYPDMMSKCAQLLVETSDIDFIDINCGCPIDLIFNKGNGSALMGKSNKLVQICRSMRGVMEDKPLTVKVRTGIFDHKNVAHHLIPRLRDAGVSLVTIHGRSREQRYTKLADWDYIDECADIGSPMPIFGNGDVLSYEDANLHMNRNKVSGVMIARGALIKPWIFTEIKEQRHWDISSSERFDILKSYTSYGLEHWGSDHQGVEVTRRFLLEWLSFLHRYIPVGVLEQVPQKINERPPYYIGRNDLETMMASSNCADWVKISEMLLGPVPANFQFLPKHKANAYQ